MPSVSTQRKANNNNDKAVERSVRRIEANEPRRIVTGIKTILNKADKVKHAGRSAVPVTA
jgi:hypothetical protein